VYALRANTIVGKSVLVTYIKVLGVCMQV
jgi:hypothetical protein